MLHAGTYPSTRLRRLRHLSQVRHLIQETRLSIHDFIFPLFIRSGENLKNPIHSMPGHFQFSLDQLTDEIKNLTDLGIKSILLFGIPENKNHLAQSAYKEDGLIQRAIPIIKNIAPQMLVITDLCFCSYTDHGHCGVILHNTIHNDDTLKLLSATAVSHAKAGADIIAPSGMMDGMIYAIRSGLDHAGFDHTPILSYAVKYASSMYGPFRDAAEGAPKFGDRKTYQMHYANTHEAIRECTLDITEGADMLMVKPAHTYLDIIYRVKQSHPALPLGAYHTSGEFAMIKAAAQNGWINEKESTLEILTAIKRAGADFIISYYAKEVVPWLD